MAELTRYWVELGNMRGEPRGRCQQVVLAADVDAVLADRKPHSHSGTNRYCPRRDTGVEEGAGMTFWLAVGKFAAAYRRNLKVACLKCEMRVPIKEAYRQSNQGPFWCQRCVRMP